MSPKRSDVASHRQEKVEGTKGKVTETFATDDRKENKAEKEDRSHLFQQYLDSAYKTFRLGESSGKGGYTFTFGHQMEQDDSAGGMKTITIPVSLEMKDEGRYTFKPYGYTLLDEKGNEYETKKIEVVENRNWIGQFEIQAPGKAQVLLTFEVPKSAEQLIMVIRHDWLPGSIVVQVK
jgi:hypothetical protein